MTALDLPAIRALHAAATPGLWEVDRNFPFTDDLVGIFAKDAQKYVVQVENQDDVDDPTSDADAAFIAAAPSIVTQLLAVVDAQQAKLDAVVALADTPDQTLVKPKGDKIFYVDAHRIRAALTGKGQ